MQTNDPVISSASANPVKRTPPAQLFLGLLALAILTVLGLFSAIARGSFAGFAAVACNLALLLGLLLGHRWAYVLVIVFAIAGAVVAFGRGGNHGQFVLLGNGVVVLPVIFSSRYFFPHETVAGNSSKP